MKLFSFKFWCLNNQCNKPYLATMQIGEFDTYCAYYESSSLIRIMLLYFTRKFVAHSFSATEIHRIPSASYTQMNVFVENAWHNFGFSWKFSFQSHLLNTKEKTQCKFTEQKMNELTIRIHFWWLFENSAVIETMFSFSLSLSLSLYLPVSFYIYIIDNLKKQIEWKTTHENNTQRKSLSITEFQTILIKNPSVNLKTKKKKKLKK